MRRTCLFFAAAALLIAAPSHASDDILLKPDHTAGIPVGVVAVEGAEIPNQGYVPLMQALQRAAAPEYSVWVALPAFLLDTPNPLQLSGKVDSARQALFAAMPNATAATKVVGFAHSLGAVFLQDHVFQNAGHFSAQFLTGASLGRKYRSKPYPVPTMALDGTLDGLYRLTRQAEAYFHMEDPAAFPVVTFEGVTHMQFASGAPPSNVAKNDLKPEVTYEAAHGMIAAAMANFMRAQLGGGGVDRAAARAAVAADVKATGVLMGPLVAALRQEGYHHFAAACNSDYQLPAACPAYPRYPSNSVERKPQDASCTCGVPFTADVAQVLMGTASASPAFPKDVTIKAADAVHAVSEITPIHLPHIWSTCSGGGGPCTLNVTTVTQPVYATLDPLDTGFYYQSASELKTKLKSRQALLLAAGVPEDAVNFTETDTEGRNCAVINNASYQWALQHAGETARARYERIGQPLEMGEDIFLSNVGPVWIYNSLKYEEAADRSKVVVRAPSSHTPVDYPIKSAAGYHYCKGEKRFQVRQQRLQEQKKEFARQQAIGKAQNEKVWARKQAAEAAAVAAQ